MAILSAETNMKQFLSAAPFLRGRSPSVTAYRFRFSTVVDLPAQGWRRCGLPVLATAAVSCLYIGAALAADLSQPEAPAATELSYPNIVIEGSAEFQFDNARFSQSGTARTGYATIVPEITVNLSEQLQLFGHFLYEPVEDPSPGSTRWFEDQGLYAEELYAQAEFGAVTVRAGKFDPAFGLAHDDAPGLYGPDLADNYMTLGALGVRADWLLSSVEGSGDGEATTTDQTLSMSIFTADTSFLSRSLFTDRGRLARGDGGVGNTNAPESFALSYRIETKNADGEIAGPSGEIGIRRLAAGEGDAHDEWSFLASGENVYSLGEDISLRTLGELVYFQHEGGGDSNAVTATAGGEIVDGAYSASLIGAVHRSFSGDIPTDAFVTASVGRTFDFETTGEFRVDIGDRYGRQDGENVNIVGIRLHKDFNWSSAF